MLQDILMVIIGLIIGGVIGFFVSRTVMKKYLKKNPPINEEVATENKLNPSDILASLSVIQVNINPFDADNINVKIIFAIVIYIAGLITFLAPSINPSKVSLIFKLYTHPITNEEITNKATNS